MKKKEKKNNDELILPHERPKRTHGPKLKHQKSTVITATENLRHVIRERDGVRVQAVSGEPAPDGGLAPNIMWWRRLFDCRCMRRLLDGLARGGERSRTCVSIYVGRGSVRGRRHAILLVAESPGVERRKLDCGRGVRE